ncbi:hypothetical protein NC652_001908 [Populus alba x Populus x berolinensis]|nr:hypothetical protein NC652_001908 [Populus alba x Populus x berolinensis]
MTKWSSCFLISATILILMAMGLSSTVQGSGELGNTIWGGFFPLLPLDHQFATRVYSIVHG